MSPRGLAIAAWAAVLGFGLVFLAIAWSVNTRSALVAVDERVAQWLHAHGTEAMTLFMLGVSHLHSPVALTLWSLIFAALLWRRGERYWVLTLAVALAGGMLVNYVLKNAYERVRPHFDDPLVTLDSFSFPSGHTAGAVLFYGVLAAFLVSRFYDWRRRTACVIGAVLAVALVAFSRLYLGAHYLSDVLAAACASVAFLALCLSAGHALVRKTLRPYSVIAAVTVLLLVAGVVLVPDAWWETFENWLDDLNPLVAFLIFCAVYGASMLLLLPVWIFPLASGAIFGFAGGLAAAFLSVGGACLAGLVLVRYAAPERLRRAARRGRMFKAIDQAVKKKPWQMVALLRLSPVIPCGLKSYFLGLTRVQTRAYLAASLAGVAPDLLIKVWLGATGRGALGSGGALNWALFAAGIVALLFLTAVVGRRVRTQLGL